MTGKSLSSSCQDADETVLSTAEVKAIATEKPMLAEKMQVDNEVARLKFLKANHQNEQVTLERRIQTSYPQMIAAYNKKIVDLGNNSYLENMYYSRISHHGINLYE
ncbi:hypothetical protein J7E73_07195 [Paenibacillus albidus]|nr:hypothetical protein [Paenibacillus albidus]